MVTESATGVGVYTVQLINHLVPHLKANKIDYHIYSYYKEQFKDGEEIKLISLGKLLDKLLIKKITLHRQIWNMVYLNFIGRKYEMLYSFSSHGSLYHKNQIITIHDLICFAYPQQHKSQYFYFKKYIPLLIKHSKQVVTISNFTKKEVLTYYKPVESAKITVIYNGVDHFNNACVKDEDLQWVNSITAGKPFCLTVGASYPHKNVETLLTVAKQLKDITNFVIVNKPNPYFIGLQQKAKEMQLNNVIFLAYVEEKKLAALYKLAKLNLYLSLYEGFGFPPAEALFFGTPSLIANQGALSEVYENMMDFTDPLKVDEIVQKVKSHINNEKEVKVLFNELKEKYNWEKSSFSTFQLINTFIQQ